MRLEAPLRPSALIRSWVLAFPVAVCVGALFVVQDVLSRGGFQSGTQPSVFIAQHLLPWLVWALLAPAVVMLLRAVPVIAGNVVRPILFHLAIAGLVAGVKLLLSAPLTALFIWTPLGVPFNEGLQWLLQNRMAPNILMYWLFVAAFTAVRHFPGHAGPMLPEETSTVERLPVTEGHRTFFIRTSAIEYIRAEDNYLMVYVGAEAHRIRGTLSALALKLPSPQFVRVHRSCIVNVDRIREIQPWYRGEHVILLDSGGKVMTSRSYRDSVRRLMQVAYGGHFRP